MNWQSASCFYVWLHCQYVVTQIFCCALPNRVSIQAIKKHFKSILERDLSQQIGHFGLVSQLVSSHQAQPAAGQVYASTNLLPLEKQLAMGYYSKLSPEHGNWSSKLWFNSRSKEDSRRSLTFFSSTLEIFVYRLIVILYRDLNF